MHLRNLEGIQEYFIPENWYRDRRKGISAMIRVKDEEEFIRPCLLSIKDFFDEIIVVLNACTDATPQIIESLQIPHMKVYHYPFALHYNGPGHDQIPAHSVHDSSYFYNWSLSKTNYEYVCKWDGDMVALPVLDHHVRRIVFKNNIVCLTEFNIAGGELAYLSLNAPLRTEPRFFKVNANTFYTQGKLSERFNHSYGDKIYTVESPVFLHFKNAKSIESATKIWPSGWERMEHFQRIHQRRVKGEIYRGVYPEALKETIVNRALRYARDVEPLKHQEEVLKKIGDLLFNLRNYGMKGHIVEVGSKLGKTTVFLSKLMETLFPDNTLYSIDPFTVEGARRSLLLEDVTQIHNIYSSFVINTRELRNHRHLKMSSFQVRDLLPDGLLFSFIDGDHSYEAVMHDFQMIFDKTLEGGIIAVDDYMNGVWPEVGKAYREIVMKAPVKVIDEDTKTAFLMKKSQGCLSRIKCWLRYH